MKKKILIAVDTYAPKKDGIIRFLEEIIPRLSKTYDITVVAPDYSTKSSIEEYAEVVKLEVSNKLHIGEHYSIKINANNKLTVRSLVKENDIIFAQDLAFIGSWAIKYGKQTKKPTFLYIHQIFYELAEPFFPKVFKQLVALIVRNISNNTYKKCSALILPYPGLKEKFSQYTTELAPLGVTEQFKPGNKTKTKKKLGIENKIVIGYSGRISPEKDLTTLLEAYKQLYKEYEINLLIVGDGEDRELFEKTQGVTVTGFVNNVVPYLQAIDIFVMPSITETTSLATLEAMTCGIPAISRKVGMLKEYIKQGFNGYHFNTLLDLKENLKKLIENKKLRQQLGKNARNTATHFSWEKTTKNITKIFEKY